MSKYHNRKVEIDGYVFDSVKEANYYQELKLRERAGDIIKFEVKPVQILQEAFESHGEKIREIKYIPDFVVYSEGKTEFVDVKGFSTVEFKLKWKMLKYLYRHEKAYFFTLA